MEAATPKLQPDSLHKLSRTEPVILFRLRTGHNRLNAHMYKFKVGESEMCPCNADIMTAEHLLQHCPLHDAMRRDTWPDPTLLRDKLYGNLEELRRTAAFVSKQASPSSVRRRRRNTYIHTHKRGAELTLHQSARDQNKQTTTKSGTGEIPVKLHTTSTTIAITKNCIVSAVIIIIVTAVCRCCGVLEATCGD